MNKFEEEEEEESVWKMGRRKKKKRTGDFFNISLCYSHSKFGTTASSFADISSELGLFIQLEF